MLQVAKRLTGLAVLIPLSACASIFSAYDSDFSCKNSDHGGCTHPLEAYEEARNETVRSHSHAGLEIVAEELDGSDHQHVLNRSGFETYQEQTYREFEALIAEPGTPTLAPAKTVRTLILPYGDPKGGQRLYMPRYIYSVLENPRFVLGNYLINRDAGLSLEALFGADKSQEKED